MASYISVTPKELVSFIERSISLYATDQVIVRTEKASLEGGTDLGAMQRLLFVRCTILRQLDQLDVGSCFLYSH